MRKAIVGIIVLVIVAFGGYKAYSYWNTTYHGTTNYAIVPTAVKHKSKTDDGKNYKQNGQQVYYYEYDFKWADANGNTKSVGWESAESTNPKPLPAGSFVTAQVSAKRVTKGMKTIDKSQVPAKALAALQ
ncbi:DUF1093 domain-containing protein [Lacticaseibacillus sp. N501-2]|uniref:DUF1093 domain-containing protein n=1 Tax=Lacticaseibacillus salsurae TaxID=3367729 RepID=UPI0038B4060E